MKMFINGKAADSSDGASIDVINPATGVVVDTVPAASCSIVFILGLVRPDKISSTVDLGTPVRMEIWRTERLFLHMILFNNIFIITIINHFT